MEKRRVGSELALKVRACGWPLSRQLPWESQQIPPPSVSDTEATRVDATVFTHNPVLVKLLWGPPAKPVS